MSDATVRPVALVTGARRGIGRGCAVALARSGFDVALNDLAHDDALDGTAALVAAEGGRGLTFAADISAIETHAGLLDRVGQGFGRLDCLVNNAGVSVLDRGDLLDVTPESYDRCQAVNTRGAFFLTQAFAKRLIADPPADDGIHRSIITITSVNAEAASLNRGEYCMSKAGLSMAVRLFALRLAELGVGVYEIRPGIIDTDMTAPSKALYDDMIDGGAVPIPRWGQPDDIGRTIATLARGLLPYTVGQAIRVDGGLVLGRL